jgi:death on curing protein
MNHPFIDGNKRTGHAAMETFLVLNRLEINASADEQEHIVLAIASGELGREGLIEWLQQNTVKNDGSFSIKESNSQ